MDSLGGNVPVGKVARVGVSVVSHRGYVDLGLNLILACCLMTLLGLDGCDRVAIGFVG